MMRVLIMSLMIVLSSMSTSNSETITTGNLLPNSGDGVDWNSSSTDQINPGGSGYVSNGANLNGFDITCPTGQANCGYKYSVGGDFEVTGTATVTADDIKLYSNTITQPMLDNGITLNSYVDVANCESNQGNCESKGGADDSHTTTMILKDNGGNVLSSVTQTRTDITGFQGNCNGYPGSSSGTITNACGQYNDRIIYLGVGANNVDWSWTGTDNNYTNQLRQGPNLLGASMTMTYNNDEFIPISDDTQDAIDDIQDNIPDDFDTVPDFTEDFTWEEDFYFEDDFDTAWDDYAIEFNDDMYFVMEEDIMMEDIGMPEEFTDSVVMAMPEEFTDFEEFEDVFTSEEEFETVMELEEEFSEFIDENFEEISEMTEEEFEEFVEEEFGDAIELVSEESEPEEVIEEEPEELEVASKEEQPTKEVNNESDDNKDVDASDESMEEESKDEESIQEVAKDEDETSNSDSNVEEAKVEAKTDTKESKVQKADIKKSKILNLDNIKVKDINIKVEKITLFSNQETLQVYEQVSFYQPEIIYNQVDNSFFEQISLESYNKDIYSNVDLAVYTQSDPVAIHKEKLKKISLEQNRIKIELQQLKESKL